MAEPFIAQIVMFGGNFAPRSWAYCEGQLLPIAQNTALFSLLGTIYGGDGRTTLALPDLRGRFPMHKGNGPGLSSRTLGQNGGNETHTLLTFEMPSHTHTVNNTLSVKASNGVGNQTLPAGNVPAQANDGESNYAPDDASADQTSPLAGAVTNGNTGGTFPHNNMPPFLCVNFIILLVGTYPSRS